MKKIYIVYEVDGHHSLNTVVLKVLTTSKKTAKKFYKEHKKEYKKDYKLVFASSLKNHTI
jgi:nucleoside diphosphate kinase